ncbi:MAG: hypothetical protein M3Q97_00855 [Bacteroidota bacterium]|nr:hypothetical protein [Bacteroidota bacterium]
MDMDNALFPDYILSIHEPTFLGTTHFNIAIDDEVQYEPGSPLLGYRNCHIEQTYSIEDEIDPQDLTEVWNLARWPAWKEYTPDDKNLPILVYPNVQDGYFSTTNPEKEELIMQREVY